MGTCTFSTRLNCSIRTWPTLSLMLSSAIRLARRQPGSAPADRTAGKFSAHRLGEWVPRVDRSK